MIIRLCVLLFIATRFAVPLSAQETGIPPASSCPISLSRLFELVDNNSSRLEAAVAKTSVAQTGVDVAKMQRLPEVEAGLSFSYLGNGYVWDRHFDNGQKASMPHWGNNFALTARQVIYAGGAISSGIKLAELGAALAELNHEGERSALRFLVSGYYLQLLVLQRQVGVYDENIRLSTQLIAQMQARHAEGTTLRNDITRYELQLQDLQLQRQRLVDEANIITHELCIATGLPAEMMLVADSALIATLPSIQGEDEWQLQGRAKAVAIRESSIGLSMKAQEERLARSALLPNVSLFAEEHLDGPVTIEVPALNNNFNYWFVGVSLRYNISSLFRDKRKLREARMATAEATSRHAVVVENTETQIHAAYVHFLTSFTELSTQEKSVQLAGENYAVVRSQYEGDVVLVTDMIDAANVKLDAELAVVAARAGVTYQHFQLLYLTNQL